MNTPDLSTRLKLMGVDVASFGDYFADVRAPKPTPAPANAPDPIAEGEVAINRTKPSVSRTMIRSRQRTRSISLPRTGSISWGV
jgi:hypothetical protein